METYDIGIPAISSNIRDQEAMILYHSDAVKDAVDGEFVSSLDDALAPCNEVDVVPSALKAKDHCVVLLEHYQGYHIQRFVRADLEREAEGNTDAKWSTLDKNKKLIHVGRGWEKGGDAFKPVKLSLVS